MKVKNPETAEVRLGQTAANETTVVIGLRVRTAFEKL
jgi:hypothetical protein